MRLLACLALLVVLAGCGKRPSDLAAPEGSTYPRTYPSPTAAPTPIP